MTVEYPPTTFQNINYPTDGNPFVLNRHYPVKIAINNNGAGNCSITWITMDDGNVTTEQFAATALTIRQLPNIHGFQINALGIGNSITIEIVSADESIDPKYLSTTSAVISGTVNTNTNITQVASENTPANNGSLAIAGSVNMGNGGMAPGDGFVTFWLVGDAMSDEPLLNGTKFGVGALNSGVGFITPRIPVKSGDSVTVTNGGVIKITWSPT